MPAITNAGTRRRLTQSTLNSLTQSTHSTRSASVISGPSQNGPPPGTFYILHSATDIIRDCLAELRAQATSGVASMTQAPSHPPSHFDPTDTKVTTVRHGKRRGDPP
jgi:hypothetical protein